MFILPFRVKNPIRRFPYFTVALMAINVAAYVLTSDKGLHIRDGMLDRYSFALGLQGHSDWKQFFTASFLHKDLVHLGINMLFLWVFGAPVEDRLRPPRFLLVYFLSGLAGAFFQAGLDAAFTGAFRPWIGATASIMGIVGAYWYVYAWSSISVFYWFVVWYGVIDVAAFFVVGLYLLLDLAQGVIYGALGYKGAIINFAHVGAGAVAVILCLAARVKRDSEAVSDAKAILADDLDYTNVPVHVLQTMLEEHPGDPEMIRGMLFQAIRSSDNMEIEIALKKAGPKLIDKDPMLVAQYLLDFHLANWDIYHTVHLLHLAGALERADQPHRALRVYRVIVDRYPDSPDAEAALYRMALCCWESLKDRSAAVTFLDELLWRYPNGEMQPYAQSLRDKIPVA